MSETGSLLVPMLIMIVIWYFLLIRPQQRKVKEHREMVNNLKKGDRVITQGGIYGKVASVDADGGKIKLEIAKDVQVEVVKSTVQAVVDASAVSKA